MKKILSIFMAIIFCIIIMASVTAENFEDESTTIFFEDDYIEELIEEPILPLEEIHTENVDPIVEEIGDTELFFSNSIESSSITITKKLVGEMWHIRCDIMDTTDFYAGGGRWKTDVIRNPTYNTSKEGHRSNKCGDDNHWIIWVDTEGKPYRMDEIKSGATGGTLPTIIYKPQYELTTEEIQNMTPEDTILVWKYAQNFINPMPWEEIKIGERLYWTTQNDGQIWYHSGIPYKSVPNFVLFIDGFAYPLVAGESIELEDLEPGIHEITEDADSQYYLGTVTYDGGIITSTDDWSIQIEIQPGENVDIEWPNVVATPIPADSPTPPSPPIVTTPSPTPTTTAIPTPTPSPTPTVTITPTPSPTPTLNPTPTPTFTPNPTPTSTLMPSPTPTLTPSPSPTPDVSPTPILTSSPTPSLNPTPTLTLSPSPTITMTPTIIPTEQPTFSPTPTLIPTMEPTIIPTITPIFSETPTIEPTITPAQTIKPTENPTPTIFITPSIKPTPTIKPKPSKTPLPTYTIQPTLMPSPTPHQTITPEQYQEIISKLPPNTPHSPYGELTQEELENLLQILDYNTPLYSMLPTGDEIPLHIILCTLLGIGCIFIYIISKRKNI